IVSAAQLVLLLLPARSVEVTQKRSFPFTFLGTFQRTTYGRNGLVSASCGVMRFRTFLPLEITHLPAASPRPSIARSPTPATCPCIPVDVNAWSLGARRSGRRAGGAEPAAR